ncbi:alpha/beta fold hydrolase [Galactobacter caseinivorans]|uniref:Alpha/beta hydrolase n=1 Tax=Galactobacter caseinivorans TaxID=2676123 RepID=A0A496PKN4_9MICC|nr:alpha/beta hydrolase [Galactobacter caseinivorans]RKW71051.1 alpha/beta hydrolase [Galactobacter caseinivorans]
MTPAPATQFLQLPHGRIAYDEQGAGPLVILVPGMAELRSTFRHLSPLLVAAGYRVVTTDLRGHGDSDADFPAYGDPETASDLIALTEAIGEPAVLLGNSLAAGAAVIAAAERPELVSALILVGPFVRNPPHSALGKALLRFITKPAWAAQVWKAYMPTLYAGTQPADFAEYRNAVGAALRRPGYARAFSRTVAQTDHAVAEARLAEVTAPSLVIMGTQDPDFKDPQAEADWLADALGAEQVMARESGHYPHAQEPQLTADAVAAFLQRVMPGA